MSEELHQSQPAADAPGVGSALTQARRSQGLSVGEAARQLKLGVRQIEALEADDYGKLPGRTIIRGFVRNYAKLLGIDAEPLLERLAGALPETPGTRILPDDQNIPFAPAREESWRRYALLALLLLLVIPLAMFESYWGAAPPTQIQPARPTPKAELAPTPAPPAAMQEQGAGIAAAGRPADEPAAAPAAVAAPEPRQEAAEAPPGQRVSMRFVFQQESWVEIRDKEGTSIFSQLNPAGSERVVTGVPPLSLVVGNASHVQLEFNGKPVNLSSHARQDVARLTLE